MAIDSSGIDILTILSELKINPSDFIGVFKIKKDLKMSINYFMEREDKKLKLFKDGKKNNIMPAGLKMVLEKLSNSNSYLLDISQAKYPELLKEIYFPPPLLFCKGKELPGNNNLKIAVVGTRKCSEYGKDAAAYLSRELSRIGFTIISGMASGIDRAAHIAGLKEKGSSIGVLGTGIDIEYPSENRDLYDAIIENGSIITEFFPGTPPLKGNFPARNRIISGMSIGVIVIEAGEKSGAVLTAKTAIRENREVFAVPGNIFSENSRGCHSLIKSGAKLVEDVDDILDEFSNYITDPVYMNSLEFTAIKKIKNLKIEKMDDKSISTKYAGPKTISVKPSILKNQPVLPDKEYHEIFNCIGFIEKSLEQLINETGISINKALQIISYLQLNNLIRENSFNNFTRIFY